MEWTSCICRPRESFVLKHDALAVSLLVSAMVIQVVPLKAVAQRAEDNAITAADDAFGTTVGNQTIGLYSPTNTRGFSPTQAENLRIEGLYFDQQPMSADMYLFSGSEVRVGIAAQSYAFPSPTGIADYKLRTPGDAALTSAVLLHGPLNWTSLEVDAQIPVIPEKLSAGLNVAQFENFDYNYGQQSAGRAISLILRYRPAPGAEIIPFFGYVHNNEHRELPYVYAGGSDPVPLFNEQKLPIENWTSWGWDTTTAGTIGRFALVGHWKLEAGLFRSIANNAQNFDDLFLAVTRKGIVDHVMDVVPPSSAGSYSGDVRLKRSVIDGNHEHAILFTVRGRDVTRHFGGDSLTDLGLVSIYRAAPVPQPPLVFSPRSIDNVRQVGEGVNYQERWAGIGTLSLGVLKTDYSRGITTPGTPSAPEKTGAVLPTVSVTVDAGRFVTAYTSYTRGLEDSVNAPNSAANRGEPPPATPTWQVDGGVQVIPRSGLKLVCGIFEIHKSYFNLDLNQNYRDLGNIQSRGIEASGSFAGSDGLTFVAGTVLLRPEIQLNAAQLGGSASVPIGPVPATINLNADYQPMSWKGFGGSIQWNYLSSRVETADDRYELPPLSTINLGLRYSGKLLGRNWLTRLDIGNVTNSGGLSISPLYLVVPQLRRNYTLTVAADL